jgi:uncharacterized protein YunC (DUF1805 family)
MICAELGDTAVRAVEVKPADDVESAKLTDLSPAADSIN